MDRKFVEAYRLSLFGRMAMGVAHEVDNHLSVVIGFSEIMQVHASNPDKVQDNAKRILMAGERIAGLIKQYSNYVRPHARELEFFSVRQTILDILLFARYDLERKGNTIEAPLSHTPWLVYGDRRDFALALLALFFNAVEALPEKGGVVSIKVSMDAGGCTISVTDNGAGIPAGMEETIFEEGVTTRHEIFNRGMGLPTARHIIAEADGELKLENAPGGGCVATIRLPAMSGA